MAVTDALSVALKSLGVASAVYEGLWDGSKYRERPENMVSGDQLNSLKLKFSKVNEVELEGLDRPQKQERFSDWCLKIVGEMVDYSDPASWKKEWFESCWRSLTGVDSDVPFEAKL